MKLLHIIAGLTALISGGVALYAAKGGKLHRQSGKFLFSRCCSCLQAARFWRLSNRHNGFAGSFRRCQNDEARHSRETSDCETLKIKRAVRRLLFLFCD